jgi:Carboxypeptidase regulatory-like domain
MGNPKRCLGLFFSVCMVFACAGALAGQTPQNRTAAIRGQIVDPSGASVPNATVRLTNPDGQALSRTTDANGAFEINNLEPGNYSLLSL